jgi:hypothetical protein
MFGLFKHTSPRFRDQLHAIAELDESVRFAIYLELSSRYREEMEAESAKVLAIQVTNYLLGDDLPKVHASLEPDVRSKVDKIKHLIETKGSESMASNTAIRELIIRFIMTTFLIYHCLYNKEWFNRPELRNRENLIRRFGGNGTEFPETEDFNRYIAFASEFIRKRQLARPAK